MANNTTLTIASSVHIESLNKIAKHLRLAHRHLEETLNHLRADYANLGVTPGAAMDEVSYVLNTLASLNDSWEQSKRGLYIEAAHDLIGGAVAPVRKAVSAKVTPLRRRSSASSLVGGEAAESQKSEVRRQK